MRSHSRWLPAAALTRLASQLQPPPQPRQAAIDPAKRVRALSATGSLLPGPVPRRAERRVAIQYQARRQQELPARSRRRRTERAAAAGRAGKAARDRHLARAPRLEPRATQAVATSWSRSGERGRGRPARRARSASGRGRSPTSIAAQSRGHRPGRQDQRARRAGRHAQGRDQRRRQRDHHAAPTAAAGSTSRWQPPSTGTYKVTRAGRAATEVAGRQRRTRRQA